MARNRVEKTTGKRIKRLERTKRVIKKRLSGKSYMMFGLDKNKIEQPHRQHKHKSKFTRDRDSLKEDKQIANRASRRKAHMAVHKHEEPDIEPKNSVKWNHW